MALDHRRRSPPPGGPPLPTRRGSRTRCGDAVVAAAKRDAHGIDDDVVVAVSRAAAEAARGIVAGYRLAGTESPTTNFESEAEPDHTVTLGHPSAA